MGSEVARPASRSLRSVEGASGWHSVRLSKRQPGSGSTSVGWRVAHWMIVGAIPESASDPSGGTPMRQRKSPRVRDSTSGSVSYTHLTLPTILRV